MRLPAQKTEVELALGGRAFTSELPFDETFHLSVAVPEAVTRIELRYRIHPEEREVWHYFPGKTIENGWSDPPIHALNLDENAPMILPNVGPLHPNLAYEFKFSVFTRVDLLEDDEADLRRRLYETLDRVLGKPENITQQDLQDLPGQLTREVIKSVGSNLPVVDAGGDVFQLTTFGQELGDVAQQLEILRTKLYDAINNYGNDVDFLLNTFNERSETAERLYALLNEEAALRAFAQFQWEGALNPALGEFASLTVKEVAAMVTETLVQPAAFEQVLRGQAAFNGRSTETVEAIHLESLILLRDFFKVISGPAFTYDGGEAFWSSEEQAEIVKDVADDMAALVESARAMQKIKDQLASLQDIIPDVLADKLLKEEIDIFGETPVFVKQESNPYVGLDIGLGYAPTLKQFFTSQFANIYFRPVNKRLPVSRLHGIDRFLKTFSLCVGISQLLDNNTEVTYRALLDETTTPLLGIGYRPNQVIVLAAGGILLSENREEVDMVRKHLRIEPIFSFSLDLNLSSALNAVGRLLGVKD